MSRNLEFYAQAYSENITPVMARYLDPESIEACAARLRVTRMALGLSQAEIARQTKIQPAAWNNAETGDNRLKIESALRVCRRYGVTLEWLFRGDIRQLPSELAEKISALEAHPAAIRRA